MFNSFTNFITDSKVKISYKAVTFLFVLFVVLLLNNLMGFTFYYNNHKKLEELSIIAELRSEASLSEESKEHIDKIEIEINQRKDVIDQLSSLFISIFNTKYVKDKVYSVGTDSLPRNNLLLFVCSSIFIVGFVVGLVISVIREELARDDNSEIIWWRFVVGNLVILGGAIGSYLIASEIPRLGDTWLWNYIVGVGIQASFVGLGALFIYIINKYDNN